MTQISKTSELVTKQELAEFYTKILPFLGTLNPSVARVDKGNMYSTTEKIVGQWTDGKPVYQKTINFGALPNANVKSVAHGISNMAQVLKIEGFINEGSGVNYFNSNFSWENLNAHISVYVDSTNINIHTGLDRSNCTANITLQYTKTTDQAVEIGTESDYSTSETVVGTWIDGKPLYQKTLTGTSATGMSTINISDLHIDTPVSLDASMKYSGNGNYIMGGNWKGSEQDYIQFYITSDKTQLCLISGSVAIFGDYAITLRYTKTTD